MFTSIASSSPSQSDSTEPFDPLATSFRPSIAVIIGVLTTMFSLTFLLLLYAKHCRRGDNSTTNLAALAAAAAASPAESESGIDGTLMRRNSGIDPNLISLLPTFTFSSLQGLKEGLECAVCLSRFEHSDVLRLLPKCKHAFHLQCVDTWLDCHSTCPLCRCKVEAQDLPTEDPKLSSVDRSSVTNALLLCHPPQPDGNDSAERSTAGFQLIVQRDNNFLDFIALQPSNLNPNSNISRNTSIKGVDNQISSATEDAVDDLEQQRIELSKRFWHRIIVSDAVFQHRWSDFKASDALFITTQNLRMQLPAQCCNRETQQLPRLSPEPASRISHSKSTKAKDNCSDVSVDVSCSDVIWRSAEYRRSMSEATGIRRFVESNSKSPAARPDEKTTRWFSIAKKTLNWLDRGATQNGPMGPNR